MFPFAFYYPRDCHDKTFDTAPCSNLATDFDAPCRTKKVLRQVPTDIPWYRQPLAQVRQGIADVDGARPMHTYTNSRASCATRCTTNVPTRRPTTHRLRHSRPKMFMAGFLPFSAIYIELHYIFASVWGHKIYTLFGILFIAFIMLFIVTSFITVALIYFQLAREDHRWWWRSFFSGGSTGFFIYAYSFFYFFQVLRSIQRICMLT